MITTKPLTVRTLVDADAQGTGPSTVSRLRGATLMLLGPLIALGAAAGLVAVGTAEWPGAAQGPEAGAFAGTPVQAFAAVGLLAGLCVLGLLFAVGGWNLWRQGRMGRAVALPAAVCVLALLGAMPWLKALFP